MGTNRVRYFREKAGMTTKELSQKTNLHLNCILQTERASQAWGRTPWPGADQRIAAALGVKLSELFSDYQLSKKHQPAELPPDTRTEEEVIEGLRLLNEGLKNACGGRTIADEFRQVEFVETQPGVFEGTGDFTLWRQMQVRNQKK